MLESAKLTSVAWPEGFPYELFKPVVPQAAQAPAVSLYGNIYDRSKELKNTSNSRHDCYCAR